MAKIDKNLLQQRISSLKIEEIAKEMGYIQRNDQKITLESLIVGFMTSFMTHSYSLRNWATGISQYLGTVITRQAVQGKFYERQVESVRKVLEVALGQSLEAGLKLEAGNVRKWKLFQSFRRVLIEDSTCQAVDPSLSAFFPTTNNGKGSVSATLRIQAVYDLLHKSFALLKLESYCDNDQKAARNILSIAQKEDLILRDRGYFILDVLAQFLETGIYFLSLWQPNVSVLEVETQKKIDLAVFLRKFCGNCVDMNVLLGAGHQLPVRLVALRLPPAVAERKRRIARQNAKGPTNHSEAYYELLGWNIFVTNVPIAIWSFLQISFAYRVRWRIETIFKCWKSMLNLKEFCTKTNILPERVQMSLYIILLLYALVFDTIYNYFHEAVQGYSYGGEKANLKKRNLSLLSAAELIRRYFNMLLDAKDWKDYIPIFYNHATYALRKDRADFESFTHNII